MRKIIVSEMISVDAYFARTDGDIDWHIVDEDFMQYSIELLKTVDTVLFGRITYQLFESYWPKAALDPATGPSDITIAHQLSEAKKIVFSKTLDHTDWNNVEVKKDILMAEIKALKESEGKDIVVYGSGTVVSTLAQFGLIDEYRLFVAPIVLGSGKSLFHHLSKVKLLETRQFANGNVLLRYQPEIV